MSSQSKDNTCPTCRGFGAVPKSGYVPKENATHKTCPTCHGSGQQEDTLTSQPPSPQSSPLDNVSESSRTPEWIGANSVFVYSLGYSMIAKAIAPLMEYTNFTKNAKGEYDQQAYLDVINNIEALLRAAETGDDEPDEALSSNNASESVRVDAPLTDSKPEKPLEQPQWDDFSIELAKRKGLIHPDTAKELTEPSKPDQLRELIVPNLGIAKAWDETGERTADAIQAIEALISQRLAAELEQVYGDGTLHHFRVAAYLRKRIIELKGQSNG